MKQDCCPENQAASIGDENIADAVEDLVHLHSLKKKLDLRRKTGQRIAFAIDWEISFIRYRLDLLGLQIMQGSGKYPLRNRKAAYPRRPGAEILFQRESAG